MMRLFCIFMEYIYEKVISILSISFNMTGNCIENKRRNMFYFYFLVSKKLTDFKPANNIDYYPLIGA